MAARAIWKGVLEMDELDIPVKFYSAVQDRNVHFHLLHDQEHARLRQQIVNSATQRPVPYDNIRKGLEVQRGKFVVFSEEELQQLQPASSRSIQIQQFVQPTLINHQWYVRPYWLGPDDSDEDYFALVDALEAEQLEGVAHWTMRNKRYLGALRAEQGYLLMITLRNAAEVIQGDRLDPPQGRQLSDREVKMANQLVGMLADDFDPKEYHEEYRQRLMDLIAAKQKGESYQFETEEVPAETDDLTDALQASLEGLK